ncbi:hypothetical protein P3S67_025719 [Capsicum chacoense]
MMHYYVGTLLDGTHFDSSRDRGTPFKFKLGEGQVIKGWDGGIKTMKKGEKALFTIPPKIAYGESGSPPTISPNATLQFEVELLSWISIKDIYKDGGIFKTILVEGEVWKNLKDLDEVFVQYEARLKDGTLVSKSDEVEFPVKDGYFCPALSKAVKKMEKGEKVLPTVKPQYKLSSLKVLKMILKERKGYDRPNDGALVKVKLMEKLQDETVFVKKRHDEEEPFEFKIDEEQIIDGLDKQ